MANRAVLENYWGNVLVESDFGLRSNSRFNQQDNGQSDLYSKPGHWIYNRSFCGVLWSILGFQIVSQAVISDGETANWVTCQNLTPAI
jgi:hypothetical protein